jgi:hypothetical protein
MDFPRVVERVCEYAFHFGVDRHVEGYVVEQDHGSVDVVSVGDATLTLVHLVVLAVQVVRVRLIRVRVVAVVHY